MAVPRHWRKGPALRGRCLHGTGTPWDPGTPEGVGVRAVGGTTPRGTGPPTEKSRADSLPRWPRGSCSGCECGDCDQRSPGEGLATGARETGLPRSPAGVFSQGPQGYPGILTHAALLPHTHPQHRDPDRGGGPPVITFPMMLPTSCRKNHRNPTSCSSRSPRPCDAGGRGPEAGRRGCAARPPVWGIPPCPSERGQPRPASDRRAAAQRSGPAASR